ncbi:MAG TPA: glycerophosphodiester phosphodiesterase [Acidimicrobiales bacterium]|jgi:glycerophosphoryl diester phosphodiesterase|nr:glycerophosphodiester phosphodiesterase [Acidimicrobiales bacterium]
MILAHRGASRAAPENTVESFRQAHRVGADGVELDVRRTADGVLVVHHDADLPGRGPIVSLRLSELPPSVPQLDAALDACGDLVVNIEVKALPGEADYDPTYGLGRLVARFVADRGIAGRVVVSSFDLSALDAALAVEPALVTGWLTPSWYDQSNALETVVARGHRALHPHHEAVTPALVTAAHAAGVDVTTWTVDDPERIRLLVAAGVDAIITNVPDVARAALSRM